MSSDQSKSRIVVILVASAITAIFIVSMVYSVNLKWGTIFDLVGEIPQNPQSEGGVLAGLFAFLSAFMYIIDEKIRGA